MEDMTVTRNFSLPLSLIVAAKEKANEAGLNMSEACAEAFRVWLKAKR